jgi:hypothetical protein
VLDGVSGQCHVPANLPLGQRTNTHCIGGSVGPGVGLEGCRKSHHPPPGFDPWTTQLGASHYTNSAILGLVIQYTAYTKLATTASSKLVYERKPAKDMADVNSYVAVQKCTALRTCQHQILLELYK